MVVWFAIRLNSWGLKKLLDDVIPEYRETMGHLFYSKIKGYQGMHNQPGKQNIMDPQLDPSYVAKP